MVRVIYCISWVLYLAGCLILYIKQLKFAKLIQIKMKNDLGHVLDDLILMIMYYYYNDITKPVQSSDECFLGLLNMKIYFI